MVSQMAKVVNKKENQFNLCYPWPWRQEKTIISFRYYNVDGLVTKKFVEVYNITHLICDRKELIGSLPLHLASW